jgi:hypothetical protein
MTTAIGGGPLAQPTCAAVQKRRKIGSTSAAMVMRQLLSSVVLTEVTDASSSEGVRC